jgi:hypothetical protein|tara:strand:+ start:747 stop:866 length:120 start_codon:yes stop_codon:yes gene_type:complete
MKRKKTGENEGGGQGKSDTGHDYYGVFRRGQNDRYKLSR